MNKQPAFVIVRTDMYMPIDETLDRYAIIKVIVDKTLAVAECQRPLSDTLHKLFRAFQKRRQIYPRFGDDRREIA